MDPQRGGINPNTWSFSGNDAPGIEVPQTCSYENLKATGSCSFAINLKQLSIELQVAMSTCTGSYWPAVSVTCGGEGCASVFTPCTTDASCGGKMFCNAPFTTKMTESGINSFFRSLNMLGSQDDRYVSDYSPSKDKYNPGFAQINKLITAMSPFFGIDNVPADLASLADLKVCGPGGGWSSYGAGEGGGGGFGRDDDGRQDKAGFANDMGCSTPPPPPTPQAQVACVNSGCPSVRMVGDGVCDPACKNPACLGDGTDCHSAQSSSYGPVTRSDSNQYPNNRYFPAPYILTKKTACTGVQTWDGKLAAGGQALSPARMAGSDLTPTAAVPASDQTSRNRKSAACLQLYRSSAATRTNAHLIQCSSSTATGAWASTPATHGLPSAPRCRISRTSSQRPQAGSSSSRMSALPPTA